MSVLSYRLHFPPSALFNSHQHAQPNASNIAIAGMNVFIHDDQQERIMQVNVKDPDTINENNADTEAPSKPLNLALTVRNLLADIECLIADAATMTNEELEAAKSKLNESVESIRNSFNGFDNGLSEKARRCVLVTNNYVHQQPWPVIGASALAGVAFGILLARRC
jgi:ElaB/YqjD/DUF883 family membrane-anchored ribosome-binding protein